VGGPFTFYSARTNKSFQPFINVRIHRGIYKELPKPHDLLLKVVYGYMLKKRAIPEEGALKFLVQFLFKHFKKYEILL